MLWNPVHLKVLEQGVETWNRWRKESPIKRPNLRQVDLIQKSLQWAALSGSLLSGSNLREANLRGSDLRESDLHGANLYGADLSQADLRGADLFRADLRTTVFSGADLRRARLSTANLAEANLSGANLAEANLSGANLAEANLSGANLAEANLYETDLRDTNLSQADLRGASLQRAILWGAKFHRTILGDTNLAAARGLDSCRHSGPSTIDHLTLLKSGTLPLPFLQGSGVPDSLIRSLTTILNNNTQYLSCFISYSTKDNNFVERLYKDLQKSGVRCWYAPEDMKIGDEILSIIDESILTFDKLLLILSQNAINSTWVKREVISALEKEDKEKCNVLIPLRLDDEIMDIRTGWAVEVRSRYIGDFTSWTNPIKYQTSFDRLLRNLIVER